MFTELLTRTLILAEVLEIGAAQEVLDQKVKILKYIGIAKNQFDVPFFQVISLFTPSLRHFFPAGSTMFSMVRSNQDPGAWNVLPSLHLSFPAHPEAPLHRSRLGFFRPSHTLLSLAHLSVRFPGFDHREFDVCRAHFRSFHVRIVKQ